MESHKLTIIIPCFNSSATLEEALVSIYVQDIKIPFEIIIVDDGSTDNTKNLIKELAKKYEKVKYFFHEKNMGGGTARNTAITKGDGDLIFCLDSDDILSPKSLDKMINLLLEKRCDGVGFSKSIKFNKKNIKDVVYIDNFGYVNEIIPFKSLFEKATCSLYSVFLFTRKSFEVINGYPTDHGFDTQGFAFRFLANGLTAYTCPETTYLHRVNFHRSYYIREFEEGKANSNWIKIFEEFLYLFNNEVQKKIFFLILLNVMRIYLIK